jgi:hypothetical protein
MPGEICDTRPTLVLSIAVPFTKALTNCAKMVSQTKHVLTFFI